MAYEIVWDQTWDRVDPGFYVNDRGMEIVKTGPATWVLNDSYGLHQTNHRTLRAAKAAADHL